MQTYVTLAETRSPLLSNGLLKPSVLQFSYFPFTLFLAHGALCIVTGMHIFPSSSLNKYFPITYTSLYGALTLFFKSLSSVQM